jgi:hypothetical protein
MSVKFEEVIEDGIIDEVLDGGGKNMEAGMLLEADAEQLSGLVKTEADGAGSVYEEGDLGGMELLGEAASQTFLKQPQPITFGQAAAASQVFLEQPPQVFASRSSSTFLQPQQLLNETIGEVFLQSQTRGFVQQHFSGGENLQNCTLSFILTVLRTGMFIPDPDFYPSRILDPDPKTASKERGEKKISCHTFYSSHKFHKIENYFIFEVKNLGQFSKNCRTFYTKNCH